MKLYISTLRADTMVGVQSNPPRPVRMQNASARAYHPPPTPRPQYAKSTAGIHAAYTAILVVLLAGSSLLSYFHWELQGAHADAVSENDTLHARVASLTSANNELADEVRQIETLNAELVDENAALENEKATLEQENEELATEKSSLQEDLASLQADKKSLQETLSQRNAEINALEIEIEGLQATQMTPAVFDDVAYLTTARTIIAADVLFLSVSLEIVADDMAAGDEIGALISAAMAGAVLIEGQTIFDNMLEVPTDHADQNAAASASYTSARDGISDLMDCIGDSSHPACDSFEEKFENAAGGWQEFATYAEAQMPPRPE